MGAAVGGPGNNRVGADDAGEELRCTLWINSATWWPSLRSIGLPTVKVLASCLKTPNVTMMALWACPARVGWSHPSCVPDLTWSVR